MQAALFYVWGMRSHGERKRGFYMPLACSPCAGASKMQAEICRIGGDLLYVLTHRFVPDYRRCVPDLPTEFLFGRREPGANSRQEGGGRSSEIGDDDLRATDLICCLPMNRKRGRLTGPGFLKTKFRVWFRSGRDAIPRANSR